MYSRAKLLLNSLFMKDIFQIKSENCKKMSPLFRGLVLVLPFLCLFFAFVIFSNIFIINLETNNPLYRVLINKNSVYDDTDDYSNNFIIKDEFEMPLYGECWSILNVDGWNNKDIPVFYGDTNRILTRGAGMWSGSRFCGQNGKTVLSAHVTKHFREIGDTEVGTVVTMQTSYGVYKYQVAEKIIFSPNDDSLLLQDNSNESLVLYTCYPYNTRIRRQRIALVCRKIEGKVFKEYE